jgi:hypothetical protein
VNAESPPTERSRGADPGSTDTNAAAAEQVERPAGTVPDQLRRRREASRRLARLAHGADPWTADHRDWQDRHDLLMAKLGLAEPWQAERAHELWRDGAR